jgi:hypothetical protein
MTEDDYNSDSTPQNIALVLARREGNAVPELIDDVRLQKLWLAAERRKWRSLAVVAASKGVDTLPVAEMFAKIAWWYRGEPSCVFDLRDLSLRLAEHQVSEVHAQVDAGSRVIVSLRSVFENPTTVSIARQVDAVLLCVALGTTKIKAAERTLLEIGGDRLVGSIVLRPTKQKAAVRSSP